MTEKEFQHQVCDIWRSTPYLDTSRALKIITDIAKQQGAEFDSEIVELPQLCLVELDSNSSYIVLEKPRPHTMGTTVVPTIKQSKEIIRRCEVVDKIRKYLTLRFLDLKGANPIADITPFFLTSANAKDVLDILDGKETS